MIAGEGDQRARGVDVPHQPADGVVDLRDERVVVREQPSQHRLSAKASRGYQPRLVEARAGGAACRHVRPVVRRDLDGGGVVERGEALRRIERSVRVAEGDDQAEGIVAGACALEILDRAVPHPRDRMEALLVGPDLRPVIALEVRDCAAEASAARDACPASPEAEAREPALVVVLEAARPAPRWRPIACSLYCDCAKPMSARIGFMCIFPTSAVR